MGLTGGKYLTKIFFDIKMRLAYLKYHFCQILIISINSMSRQIILKSSVSDVISYDIDIDIGNTFLFWFNYSEILFLFIILS